MLSSNQQKTELLHSNCKTLSANIFHQQNALNYENAQISISNKIFALVVISKQHHCTLKMTLHAKAWSNNFKHWDQQKCQLVCIFSINKIEPQECRQLS